MTDQERSIHAQVSHLGSHQKEAMLKIARGAKVNKQTISSLESKGWLTHEDYRSITLTDDGSIALRLINEGV